MIALILGFTELITISLCDLFVFTLKRKAFEFPPTTVMTYTHLLPSVPHKATTYALSQEPDVRTL